MIETQVVNGYPLRVKGDAYVVLVFDPQQAVTPDQIEQVKSCLASCLEVGTRHAEGKGVLHCFKTSDPPDLNAIRAILPQVQIALLKPVLPVITRPERKPQLYDTMTRWREIAAAC